jgi:hypothetical protein
MIENFLSMHRALGSILSTAKTKHATKNKASSETRFGK